MKGPLARLLAKMKCLKESSLIFLDFSTSPKVPRPKWQAAGSTGKNLAFSGSLGRCCRHRAREMLMSSCDGA